MAANSDPADIGPGQPPSNQGASPGGSDAEPGPHRFIGIGMVAGLAFVLLVLWLACAAWPRRMAGFGPRRRRHKEMNLVLEGSEEKLAPMVDVIIRPPKAKVNEAKALRSSESTVGDEQHFNKARAI